MKERIKKLLVLIIYFMLLSVHATQVSPKKLSKLVADADHVIIGKVINVDMVGKDGKEIKDLKSPTGPGLENKIRLHVKIEKDGVLKTNKKDIPKTLVIALWQMWHYTLGQWKETAEGKNFIFLLKGNQYEIVYPFHFRRKMSEKHEIEKILK